MKKIIDRIQWHLCCNLSRKIEKLFPEGYEPNVVIGPCYKSSDKSLVLIAIKVPNGIIKKLMWHFKAWKEN